MMNVKRAVAVLICGAFLVGGIVQGYAGGVAETVEPGRPEISILGRYFGDIPPNTSNEIFRRVQDATNTTLRIEAIPAAGYADVFAVRVASRELPDVLRIYDISGMKHPALLAAAREGVFWEAGQYVIDHFDDFPNLARQNPNVREVAAVDGRHVFLAQENIVGRPVFIYRADVAREEGISEVPRTPEDVYALFSALARRFEIGAVVGGIGAPTSQWGWMTRVATWFGAPHGYGIDDQGQVIYAPLTDGWIEGLRFAKRLFDDGLINSDFPAPGDIRRTFYAGRAGAIPLAADNLQGISLHYEAEDLEDADFDMFGVINEVVPIGPGLRHGFAIPRSEVTSEAELQRVLRFLDTVASPEFESLFQVGIVGVHSEIAPGSGGRFADVIVPSDERAPLTWAEMLLTFGLQAYTMDPTPEAPMKYYPERVMEVLQQGLEFGLIDASLRFLSDTRLELEPQLNDIIEEASTQFVFGVINEAGYRRQMQRWLETGGQRILDEYQQQYDALGR
jgi:putative aldouronate transport system substrate-binding protein